MSPVLTSPVVSTQWLADHLGSDELVVLDASVHTHGVGVHRSWEPARDQYVEDGHVPGAAFADLVDELSAPDAELPFTRPDVARFERAVGALGVSNETTVVVYDWELGQWAARLWWLFRSFGHDRVAVLDGGWAKWVSEGRPTRVGELTPHTATFRSVAERPIWADRDRVARAVDGSEPAALVFAAEESVFGDAHPPLIPGSTVIPMQRVLDRAAGTFLRTPRLAQVLEPVLGADEVVAYCGVGTAACVDALALTLLGHDKVRVYDGSLADWWSGAAVAS